MATPLNPQENYLEIVFAGKNKSYGAYQLRRNYEKQLTRAVLIGSGLLIILSTLPTFFRTVEKSLLQIPAPGVITIENYPVYEKTLPVPKSEPVKPVKSTIRFQVPKIVPDPQVKDETIPTQNELRNVDPGTVTVQGTPGAEDVILEPVEVQPVVVNPTVEHNESSVIRDIVEEMPLFPGGSEALMSYIVTHTQYPDIARMAGIEGKVFITFVVERDGSISNAVVAKGIGGGCDDEALRVITSMPSWKAGRQNGTPVRVKVSIPVQFRLR